MHLLCRICTQDFLLANLYNIGYFVYTFRCYASCYFGKKQIPSIISEHALIITVNLRYKQNKLLDSNLTLGYNNCHFITIIWSLVIGDMCVKHSADKEWGDKPIPCYSSFIYLDSNSLLFCQEKKCADAEM